VAVLDFSLTLTSAGTQTVIPGASTTYNVQVAPLNVLYPGTVTFSVSGLPAGATATFTPSTVAANGGTVPVTMTVQTASQLSLNKLKGSAELPIALALLVLPFAAFKRRKSLSAAGRYLLLAFIVLAGAAATTGLTGCGTGNGFFGQAPQNYNLTITATSGTIQHSVSVTLNVQ
jgi:hypothetical protein